MLLKLEIYLVITVKMVAISVSQKVCLRDSAVVGVVCSLLSFFLESESYQYDIELYLAFAEFDYAEQV
jgi:hypothetical protein